MTAVDAETRGTWTILSPVSAGPAGTAIAHRLDRAIAGVRVGFCVDAAWSSYFTILDEWDALLKTDGAESNSLWLHGRAIGGITYAGPDERWAVVDEWSKLVECGVVGLGN